MKSRTLVFVTPMILFLFLALVPTALASNKWYVDGVNGSDTNNCKSRQHACKTIGHAISLAASGDSILVAAATYTENLTISFSLKLVGSGATTTIIDPGGGTVVWISSTSAHVTLSRLTIRNGRHPFSGGGIRNDGTLVIDYSTISGNSSMPGYGGGIANSGTLTISNSTITANRATAAGGGIANAGTLTVSNSTLSGNSAYAHPYGDVAGGGISNGGTLRISNSTINGNSAFSQENNAFGGGIANSGTLTISNSTISGNEAGSQHGSAFGGGIAGTATLQNSIVANSPSGGNCYGTMTSKGYNLSSDGTCNFNGAGDLNSTDPKLGPLQYNGGPTQTQALLPGSPATDAGNPSGCTDGNGHLLKTDQRGKPRPDKEDTGGCDMGAYERQKD